MRSMAFPCVPLRFKDADLQSLRGAHCWGSYFIGGRASRGKRTKDCLVRPEMEKGRQRRNIAGAPCQSWRRRPRGPHPNVQASNWSVQ